MLYEDTLNLGWRVGDGRRLRSFRGAVGLGRWFRSFDGRRAGRRDAHRRGACITPPSSPSDRVRRGVLLRRA